MELGIKPNIDQFKENNSVKIQQVQGATSSSELKTSTKPEEIFRKSIEDEVSGVKNVQKTASKSIEQFQEVVLANANFGFNSESSDFFIKVERGNATNQYPTDQMMRFKTSMRDNVDNMLSRDEG